MDELKIAVCDDDAFALGAITGALQSIFSEKEETYQVSTFKSALDLEAAMKSASFDLLLLDIDMPKLDGIEFGKKLRENNDRTAIIYVSNREERVFESFQMQPLGFVRKSSFFKDLSKYIDLYIKECSSAGMNNDSTITAYLQGGVVTLFLSDIIYIESQKKSQKVVTNAGVYTMTLSMHELEKKLEPEGFLRVHHGYLVNYKFISLIGGDEISLKGGKSIPLSRRKTRGVKERYFDLMRSRGTINI